ncbi:MAG: arsenite methyltransferase [Nitrospirales bacterium]|nr:arsenite methyltransferase [Nitrospirales bacterium]
MKENEVKVNFKESYAKIAGEKSGFRPPGYKGERKDRHEKYDSRTIGYPLDDLRSGPEGINLGLGCGSPVALASLQEGEVVVDLGSGTGFDCFLAVQKVGSTGKVIGVDMTLEMVNRARRSAEEGGYLNVEFRLGEIENLPLADNSINVVISNCVINLAQDKTKVFQEAFRALKPGGRMMISDIVLTRELPMIIKESVEGYHACVSGAMIKDEYLDCIELAGFQEIKVLDQIPFPLDLLINDPTAKGILQEVEIDPMEANKMSETIVHLKVQAYKRS